MTSLSAPSTARIPTLSRGAACALAALGSVVLVMTAGPALAWAVDYPRGWTLPASSTVRSALEWLSEEAVLGPIAVRDLSRAVAWLIEQPMDFLQGILSSGFYIPTAPGEGSTIPPLPWLGLTLCACLFGHWADGRRGALLVCAVAAYLVTFGLWQPGMLTFASVLVAAAFGLVLGIALGILGHFSPAARALLMPLYDLMQTLPIFAYLAPMILFFGFGQVSALVATLIYATPPMARVTTLALDRVPANLRDLGTMSGCTLRQQIFMVLLPAAGRGLRVGLNQLMLLTLAMVIIASIIGAGGLGADVLAGLQSLQLGRALEAGIAITLMAIAFDRLSAAIVDRRRSHDDSTGRPWWRRHPYWLAGGVVLVATTLAGVVVPPVRAFPDAWTISTGSALEGFTAWVNATFYTQIAGVRDWTILNVMRPVKAAFLAMPWLGVVLLASALGYWAAGARKAAECTVLMSFIAVTGFWDEAMISLYLVSLSVLVALALGVPIGIWAAVSPYVDRFVTVVIDVLQTLPNFVYLIPVVILFSTGDFPALVAIVLYAMPPAIRYTKEGLKSVNPTTLEVADMSGCTRWQKMREVQFPLALPDIMLAVNQTIMIAFSMLVITSLIGTRGLEQVALAAVTKVQPGEGVIAGLGIACLAMTLDRLTSGARERMRAQAGGAA